MTLFEFFKANNRIAIGFSGGVDSSYLLYAAVNAGADVTAYYVKTAFQPDFELEDAKRIASQVGAEMKIIESSILETPHVADNPRDRCYYCKTAIFSLIKAEAAKDGFTLLADGTNASDDSADRPGMKALKELSVCSPLRECGLTKSDIRRLSKEAGLFTWDKPAYACLATRIPTGTPITRKKLENVEKAEDVLFSMGFTDFRVRLYGEAARLQVTWNQLEKALAKREDLLKALTPYFDAVLLDLNCR